MKSGETPDSPKSIYKPKLCEYCAAQFDPGPRDKRFCTPSHAKKAYWAAMKAQGLDIKRPNMKGVPKPARRVAPIYRQCERLECENTFLINGGGNNSNKRFCTASCRQQFIWAGRREGTIANLPNAHDSALKDIPEAACAWLAAAIDGEGSIVFRDRKNPTEHFSLAITNSNTDFLQKAVELTGTGAILGSGTPRKAHHAPVFTWSCHGLNAEIILRQIYPHVIIKKLFADVALGFVKVEEAPYTERTIRLSRYREDFAPAKD